MSTITCPDNRNPKATNEELDYRQKILGEIIEEAKSRGDIINENYLCYYMRLRGFLTYTRKMLYTDRLALDSQNNYIRNFLPRYSRFQEEILDELNDIRDECIELGKRDWGVTRTIQRETKDGLMKTVIMEETNHKPIADFMRIRAKVAELKQKHGEGQNIQISAVIVQKELANKKKQIYDQQEKIKELTILSTKQN